MSNQENIKPIESTPYKDARQIIESARNNAVGSVDSCRVKMYLQLDQRIFEEEQQGKERAEYGTYLIHHLSKKLEPENGSGFGHIVAIEE